MGSARALAQEAERWGLGRCSLAQGIRWARRHRDATADLPRRTHAPQFERAWPCHGDWFAGAHADALGHRRTETPPSSRDPAGRRVLVSGLLGTRIGIRPCFTQD